MNKSILHYNIIKKLGEGGMGVVYLAEDTKLKRQVAIKSLPKHISTDSDERKRFEIEAQATAALNHPHIATIHAIEEVDDEAFIVMEYIEGRELRDSIGMNGISALPFDTVVDYAIQIAEGLHAAHKRGIIHRDVKSSNIMITEDGLIKIMDFGLAKISGEAHLTKAGRTVGTAAYMSPEQTRGEEIDHRTDLWSFGVVLYEMVTGRLPFRGDHEPALLYSINNEEPSPLTDLRSDLPNGLVAVVEGLLQKDRSHRYGDLGEVIAALQSIKTQQPLPPQARKDATKLGVHYQVGVVLRAEVRSYGILMGDEGELATRNALDGFRKLVIETIETHGGKAEDTPCDTIVAIFDDPSECVACAKSAMDSIRSLNERTPPAERVHYRFGIARGEVIGGEEGLSGSAVERAGELASLARTDGISMSEGVRKQVAEDGKISLAEIDIVPGESHPVPPQLESLTLAVPDRPSVAILPFTCIGADPEGEAIAEGLRIDITNALMKMKEIFLIAPSSMNHFRGMGAEEVATRLGTRHVLEGAIRRAGERVRVTMQLTDTAKQALVWSESYDRVLDDTFILQDEIAERVITELDVKLSIGEQARVWRKCLIHPKAREFFYKGLHEFFQSTAESVVTAQAYFERVAEMVPASPVGATWTALSLWLQSTRDWTDNPEETRKLATSWAERAASQEDADGQAHTVLGAVLLLERRFDEAVRTARDSVVIRPGCNTANGVLASVLLYCGEYDQSIVHAKRAIRIGPVYPPLFLETLAASYREAGKVGLSISVAREILRLVPDTVHGRLLLASGLVRSGWLAEARRIAREVLTLDSRFSVERFLETQPYRSGEVLDRMGKELMDAGLPV